MDLLLQRYTWVGSLLATVLCAYLAARVVNTFAGSAIAVKPSLQALTVAPRQQTIAHAELDAKKISVLFGVPLPEPTPAAGADAPGRNQPTWNPEPQRSPLHAVLVGTAIATPERYSLCQLTNTDQNETGVYAVGDTFMSARIYAIERLLERQGDRDVVKERVLLVNEGRNEYIDSSAPGAAPTLGVVTMPPPVASGGDGVRQISENQYVVAKKEIDNALTNLSDLATKARIVPSFKNGVPNGFKLFSIVPDSLYAKIGVQNGDVIRRINGYEMNSPDKALEIYQKLRDANRIEIEVERRGDTVRKSYSIE